MKKIVAFDIDGVLADFESNLVSALVEEFGGIGSLNRHLYSLEKRFKDHPKVLSRAIQYVNDPNFCYALDPIYPACMLVDGLMDLGFGVMHLTSRPRSHETFTRRWLQKHTPDYKSSLGLFCGVSDKSDFLKDVDIELLVEDNPEEITRCKNSNISVACWSQPWNDDICPKIFCIGDELFYQPDEETDAVPFWSILDTGE